MKVIYRHLNILMPVFAVFAVICLLAPAQGLAADDPAMTQIEADIRTAHVNADDAALETGLNRYKADLKSQGMTDEEIQVYLDNWLRQLPGITNEGVTGMMADLFPVSFVPGFRGGRVPGFLKDRIPPELPIVADEKIPSPL